jgi:hypothetical protein
MNESVQILFGIGLFILIALLVGLVGLLVRSISKLNGIYQGVDQALVAFGQTGVGHLANQSVKQASTYFDEATDPAIIQLANLAGSIAILVQFAKTLGIELTATQLATWGRAIFAALDNLTDGEPESEAVPGGGGK